VAPKQTRCSNNGFAFRERGSASTNADVTSRSLDDLAFFIDDEMIGATRVNERQSIPSGILAHTTLTHARNFAVTDHRLYERRLDPKSSRNDLCIDDDCALFEFDRAHQLALSRPPMMSGGFSQFSNYRR